MKKEPWGSSQTQKNKAKGVGPSQYGRAADNRSAKADFDKNENGAG